jgi:phosphomannomutase
MKVAISDLMQMSGVNFGTSGVRGPVSAMTDRVCWAYTQGFLQYLENCGNLAAGARVGLAGDLRNSTARIMSAVSAAILDAGFTPVNYGKIPSPAIALHGLRDSIPTIMVTGSHIPEDRNGIKFNTAQGEILKRDEQGIRGEVVELPDSRFNADGALLEETVLQEVDPEAETNYVLRYLDFFPENCLAGARIGLYEHSSVARDCLNTILTGLGARVTPLGRSDHFVSVDTEAIRQEDVELAKNWSLEQQFDCIISTDGDGDRPLVSDENGNWLRGDVAGILCASYLKADIVVTPVSSNSAVEKSSWFQQVLRTRIGSPYVIAAMEGVGGNGRVIGYEANGGFLQQNEIEMSGKVLTPLPTRDATIVPLAILMLSREKGIPISGLLEGLPGRYTASDRLKNFPTELSREILSDISSGDFSQDREKLNKIFGALAGQAKEVDLTDGVRITFENDEIIHLRPSGNAPELRCYTEAETPQRSVELNREAIRLMEQWR